MSEPEETLQSFSPGTEVFLWEFDFRSIPGAEDEPPVYFSAQLDDGVPIVFDGNTYAPASIEGEGFDLDAEGALPQPVVRIGNASRIMTSFLVAFDDCLGCTVTRRLVWDRFLDGKPDADPTAVHRTDVLVVEQLVGQDPREVVFRLTSFFDQDGETVPRRGAFRTHCQNRYRRYNAATDDFTQYANASGGCPYDGAVYFNAEGQEVAEKGLDRCSKLLDSGCVARYGDGVALPFAGFPALGDEV